MLISRSHLYTIVILSFGLGGLVCVAVPAMARDIIRWHREFFGKGVSLDDRQDQQP